MTGVDTLTLPTTGFRLDWRDDGWWRGWWPGEVDQAESGIMDAPEWQQWEDKPSVQRRGTGQGTQSARVAFGNLPDGLTPDDVNVRLDDGQQLPISGVGRLWACEWTESKRGTSRAMVVRIGGWDATLRPVGPPRDEEGRPLPQTGPGWVINPPD